MFHHIGHVSHGEELLIPLQLNGAKVCRSICSFSNGTLTASNLGNKDTPELFGGWRGEPVFLHPQRPFRECQCWPCWRQTFSCQKASRHLPELPVAHSWQLLVVSHSRRQVVRETEEALKKRLKTVNPQLQIYANFRLFQYAFQLHDMAWHCVKQSWRKIVLNLHYLHCNSIKGYHRHLFMLWTLAVCIRV